MKNVQYIVYEIVKFHQQYELSMKVLCIVISWQKSLPVLYNVISIEQSILAEETGEFMVVH